MKKLKNILSIALVLFLSISVDSNIYASQSVTQYPSFSSVVLGAFGDCTDGNLTFDGSSTVVTLVPSANVYTMTADIYARNITINNGVTVSTAGFIIYACETLTIQSTGTLAFNGNNASGATGGAAFSSVGSLSTSAGAGANGRNTTGAGSNGGGSGGNNIAGSTGGGGGQGDGGNLGGTATASSSPSAASGNIRSIGYLFRKRLVGTTQANTSSGGGSGGVQLAAGSITTSGSGGGAGGLVVVSARTLNNQGTISAIGGNGSNATGCTGAASGGGGGGGAGGAVWILSASVLSEGTITVAGGTHGNACGTGTNGSDGTNGRIFKLYNL